MFTEFDVVVIIIVLFSALIGFMRGLIKEVFSLAGWIGAGVVTFYLFPYLAAKMDELFKSPLVVNVASIIVVFLLVLAIISLFNAMVLDNLRELRAGPLDRSLGTVFGMFRGVLMVSIMHFLVLTLHGQVEPPEWLEDGETYALTKIGGDELYVWAKDYVKNLQEDDDQLTDDLKEIPQPKAIELPDFEDIEIKGAE